MYRGKIGAEIEDRLAGHAALLRRWLDALRAGGPKLVNDAPIG